MSLNNSCNFTTAHYIQTLKNYKNTHSFSFFDNCSSNDVILRHDIDFSLHDALRIAKIDNKIGIRSTYFVLLHSELYNPFGYISSKLILEILKLGHKIGLHYDEIFFEQTGTDISTGIEIEINLLKQHFNTDVDVVTRHNPSVRGKKIPIKLPSGVVDAMSGKYTVERKYLSDSVQYWRENCFCNHQDNFQELQITTHPALWTDEGLSRSEILPRILKNLKNFNEKQIQDNSALWERYVEDRIKEKNNKQT